MAEFEVIINKYADDLDPTSDVLAIQDVLSSNLRFIPDSLTITPANDSIAVQHDEQTNTLTFTNVPDETTFVIKYQARVLGSGNVTYSNTVKFGNFEKAVEETAVVQSSGGGTGSNPSITLVKRDSEMLSVTLAGATFQLYYIDNGNQVPVVDHDGQYVTFTTDAEGKALIVGHLQNLGWTLWADRTYCLIEVTAPDGYEISNEPTYFVLTENPSNQTEFDITGDQLSVQNDAIRISVPVAKQWIGPVGADEVVIHLLADGTDTGKTVTLTAENGWAGSFEDLRKYDDAGSEIQYSIEEESVNNYDPQYAGSAEDGYVITNINTETVEIPVVKQWVGPAAESVTILLTADGQAFAEVTLNEESGWQYTFTDLPKYDGTDGHEIAYDVQEVPVEGYEQSRSGSMEAGFVFINTITGKVSVPVKKTWIGPAGESVTVELLADGVKVAEMVLSEENGWQYTFTDLDQYDNGVEIVYTIREVPLDGYSAVITGDQSGYTIINTNTETIDIPVVKKWIGPVPEQEIILQSSPNVPTGENTIPVVLLIQLTADGVPVEILYLSSNGDYSGVFTGVPKYDSVDGHEIEYSVVEINVPENYSVVIAGDTQGGFIITNFNTETVEIPVVKQWVGPAAGSVTVFLTADGQAFAEITLNEENGWQYTFTDLPKYDGTDGHEIAYDVQEVPVQGYEQSRSGNIETGFVFTNTITGKVSVSVTKTWIGPAGESVTVELLADGVKVSEIILSEENGWQYTFADLDQYDNGVEIVYTIREVTLDGYSTVITGDQSGYTIINTNTDTRTISVEKRWIGEAAKNVTIDLYADGIKVADIVLNKANNWKHAFTDLPKYDSLDGHEIVYTITENALSGYTTSVTGDMQAGFVVTNTKTATHIPNTGDAAHLPVYVVALILSGAALIWTVFCAKRRSGRRQTTN